MKENLKKLRDPFPEHQISKLPKGTKAQNECPANEKVNCKICGGWHHPRIVHLDYVGHAALTDRLLDVDPEWNWEPLAVSQDGYPVIDKDGGMWIKLTVCGVTRLGYGDAQGKTGGNAMKERIGDAMRNAAMRFGAALELWHKGELHAEADDSQADKSPPKTGLSESRIIDLLTAINDAKTGRELKTAYETAETAASDDVAALTRFVKAVEAKKAKALAASAESQS